MNSKERNIMENESNARREAREQRDSQENSDLIAGKLKQDAKEHYNNGTRKVNRLWIWFGVLILIAILLYWLFSIGMFEDLAGTING